MTVKRMNRVEEFLQYDGTNATAIQDWIQSGGNAEGGADISGSDPLHVVGWDHSHSMTLMTIDVPVNGWVTIGGGVVSDADLGVLYSPANETPS